ncbi:MAG: lysophospholipid acyltransferase family protein [Phycisphaerales bacterium]|nr:lysophospholipid acyltransferase family protein [Phycisphaerales bacterium]MCB9862350.1 lysophospholipid acyltransferase family protein [Phycisphaerales bacterium]
MGVATQSDPFRIDFEVGGAFRRAALGASRGIVEGVLGLSRLKVTYANIVANRGTQSFEAAALEELGVCCRTPDADLANVPVEGAVVVVANHPFGGVEGLMLTAMLRRVRPDVKIISNTLLGRIPELHETQIFVDVFGGADVVRRNAAAMRKALEWVRAGHCLAVFPAGEVSHYSLQDRVVTDSPWSESITRLIGKARATVVPVYFDGRNSRLFQAAGLVHPRLRTAMLAHEVYNRDRRNVLARIGRPIRYDQLEKFQTQAERTAYLRLRTYLLRSGVESASDHSSSASAVAAMSPIAPPESHCGIVQDVVRLGESKRLLSSGAFDVYYAEPGGLPHLLPEIGRLREVTFRAVGEGSGLPRDLDRYDAYYHHLFVWHRDEQKLVGAYRMGRTDDILAAYGVKGLYTNSLFRFRERLMREMGPALELGRSFVVKEYQKTYSPLLLLWKGIAAYLVANPRYRSLFGAVSISDDYHSMTKQLLMAFLKSREQESGLARLARPKNPPRRKRSLDLDPELIAMAAPDLKDVDQLISEIERDGKPMPVLLRQYLKLNGKLLGFNVDPAFGNVLDGLILVQLDRLERATLDKYMGRAGASMFRSHRGT